MQKSSSDLAGLRWREVCRESIPRVSCLKRKKCRIKDDSRSISIVVQAKMLNPVTGWVDLFARQVYRDMVLDSWRYCQAYKGFQVHAYTFMSNHLHLIASCMAPFRLGHFTISHESVSPKTMYHRFR
jgi:hypothetical protein